MWIFVRRLVWLKVRHVSHEALQVAATYWSNIETKWWHSKKSPEGKMRGRALSISTESFSVCYNLRAFRTDTDTPKARY